MIEPRPLPPGVREELSQKTVSFICPKGHRVPTPYTRWELQVLGEQRGRGGNYIELECGKCQTSYRVDL